MTYALFEDTGKLLTGRLISPLDTSSQIELESGKRVKVKASHVLIRFDQPEPSALLAASHALAKEIDLAMSWEFAPLDEFTFTDLAREYFSSSPSITEQAAILIALHGAPHYFRRGGQKGHFKKADAAVLALALAAIEKKKQVIAQIDEWAQALANRQCPQPILEQLYKILFKPDKNAPEYKAVVQASRATQLAPLVLLQAAGAIGNPYQFHWQRFLFEAAPPAQSNSQPASQSHPPLDLPLAAVRAFSIDDAATTEIDDALSVQGLGTHEIILGIHIAAPALGITPGDAIDKWARARLSTVYMPGNKITMLPDAIVQPHTLQEESAPPAVSLYVRYDAQSMAVLGFETKVERVPIAANLRYDLIDHIVTSKWLSDATVQTPDTPAPVERLRPELSWLFKLAQTLKAQREVIRGKPETFNRPDYSFKLEKNTGTEPQGDERVSISPRVRGAPLDLIVAECMIVANSTWGGWLATLGVPAIYRSQASLGFGSKVRMSTKSAPHAGIGVPSYAWSTSPLRRYTDLVNQWQIVAAAQHGAMAALAAPFKPKDAALFSIIASFEDAYASYNQFQNTMERFWTLKYIEQAGLTELDCTVVKDNLVRADSLPLMLPALGAQELPRGARLRIALGQINFIALEVSGKMVERLDTDAAFEQDMEDEDVTLGTVAIAMDVSEQAVDASDPT